MKKIAIYEAFDGERFDTEEKCREYEVDALNCMEEIFDKVQFFDGSMKLLAAPEENNVDKYMDIFDVAYDKASYMYITERLSEVAIDFVWGYMVRILPDGVGLFKYDANACEWKAAE